MHNLLKTIMDCPLRSNDKSDASTLTQSLVDVYAATARTAFLQAQVSINPTVEGYFKARSKFQLKEPNLQIYTKQRKVRTTGTAFQSIALLNQGHRIEEIAQIRNLTVKTVVKHIRSFIEDGIINISDIFPADRRYLH